MSGTSEPRCPPSALRAAGLVATSDLRRRVRNRSALITAFAGPLVFSVVFSVLVGGASSPTFEIGVVDLDRSTVSTGLVDSLIGTAPPISATPTAAPDASTTSTTGVPTIGAEAVTFVAVGDRASAEADVDDGRLDGAIVVPAGFGTATGADEASPLVVLQSPDRPVGGQVAQSVAASVTSRFTLVATTAALAGERTGAAPDPALLAAASDAATVVVLGNVAVGGRDVSPAGYYGAAMSILFLFFTTGFAARSILAEKRDGTLARLLSGPTPPAAVIGGKTASVSLLGLAGFVTVWAVTALLFGAYWGPPVAVLALMTATVVAVAGVATLVASLARTRQQAESYTAMVTFGLALIGGNFLGPGQLPEVLSRLALLTPNGWALRGFTDLAADAGSMSALASGIAVLLAFGAVCGTIGLIRVHRLMVP